MISETADTILNKIPLEPYLINQIDRVMTPALALYPKLIDKNIQTTIELLGGNPNRWRPHVKTSKLAFTMRRFAEHGIRNFKCSTSLELLTVCEAGASDVLVAYPMVGANARRVREISQQHPAVKVSSLVETEEHIAAWHESNVGLFIDVNPGMNRTGIDQDRVDEIVRLAIAIRDSGQECRGIHYYDGHVSSFEIREREASAHKGYDRLMHIIESFERSDISVPEIVTAGTPAFPATLTYPRFNDGNFVHRASPGTVIYNDCSSLTQLPEEFGYEPAALVVSTVVSRPATNRLTCDAGHKTVSADAGVPTCSVVGHPKFAPDKPSEEHLPIDFGGVDSMPSIGDTLYLLPKHICPTINNFDHALIVDDGNIVSVEKVTARGREVCTQ